MKYTITVETSRGVWQEFVLETEVGPDHEWHSWCELTDVAREIRSRYGEYLDFGVDFDMPETLTDRSGDVIL